MGDYLTRESPRSTAALRAFCEAGRAHHFARGDHLASVAASFELALRKTLGASNPAGAYFIARRVTRPLKLAAGANIEIAGLFVATWHRYEEKVLNVRPQNSGFKI